MKYCDYCHKEIPEETLFCPHCGRQDTRAGSLIGRAEQGDQEAVSRLYEWSYDIVYRSVRPMFKDEDTVFDIIQDAYIKAFTHLGGLHSDDEFIPWIRRIARNTALDWLKKKRPLLFSQLSAGEEQEVPVEELLEDKYVGHIPDRILDQKETQRLIRQILDELPEDQRAVIIMFYFDDMSVREIAEMTGATESAVKSRLLYGRRKIEKKVRELEQEGTKLYGMAPLPFLLWLVRDQYNFVSTAPDRVIRQNLFKIQAGQPVASASASGAGAIGSAAASKIVIGGILASIILGGGIYGIIQSAQPVPGPSENQIVSTILPEKQDDINDWIAQEEASGRVVLTGTIDTYTYDEAVELQGMPDWNEPDNELRRIIVVDPPKVVRGVHVDGYQESEVRLILVTNADISASYDGRQITFSVSPETLMWPSDTRIPVTQPGTNDIHIMDRYK
ncbi:MAG: sigma-70 family RNA polymerase sigma factor [Clostridiales bacterium]|nr:sigma-70 family RNA polymerase sigma factor [Clostridiales bacterium]